MNQGEILPRVYSMGGGVTSRTGSHFHKRNSQISTESRKTMTDGTFEDRSGEQGNFGVTLFMERLHLFSVKDERGAGKMAPQERCLLLGNPKFNLHSGRRKLTIPSCSLTSTSTP